jgi:protein-S-isoprenylcysteine O-methyltransferase Ste14
MKLLRPLEARVPPPVWTLLAGAAMAWADARWPLYDVGGTGAERPLAMAGVAAGVLGLGIAADSLRRFVAARTTWHPTHPQRASALVIEGPYRYTRNPMYLGLLLMLVGWGLWLGSVAALAVVPAWMALLTRLQIEPEERALLERFGGDYAQYRDSVRRWYGRR